jgi:hypothetical protein
MTRKIKTIAKKTVPQEPAPLVSPQREKSYEIFLAIALLLFGVYVSVLYFGYTQVPNSDFPGFYQTGQEILRFEVPTSFKRGPVVGILQVFVNLFVRDHPPSLTSGWLVNAALYPFIFLLLWRVAERIVGRSGVWIALLCVINPWTIYMLTQPIAETTLLFFALLTVWLIFRHSRWCYLAAAATTMVRYEGAALILACFLIDVIERKEKRQRLRALLFAAAATLPLALWMFGTLATGVSGQTHYLRVLFGKHASMWFKETGAGATGFTRHKELLEYVAVFPFTALAGSQSQTLAAFVSFIAKVVPAAGFCVGAVWGLIRRRWDILVLLLFFVPYFTLHAMYPYPLPRYYQTVFWIFLLLSWYGLQSIWTFAAKRLSIRKTIALALGILVALVAVVRLVHLVPLLPKTSSISPQSLWLVCGAAILAAVIFISRCVVSRGRDFLPGLIVLLVVSSVIASNNFALVRTIGDGQNDKEFKILGQWYRQVYQPGDKLALYMSSVVQLFAPQYSDSVVSLPKADSPQEFVEKCRAEGITYVAWASREMLNTNTAGYKLAGLANIAFLDQPRDIGPYKFVHNIDFRGRRINVFRLETAHPAAPNAP